MNKKLCGAVFVIVFIGLTALAPAQMSSDNYQITTTVMSGGGGVMTSTSETYQMNATLGQPTPLMDAAVAPGSDGYLLYPGFWYTLDAGLAGCLWDYIPKDGDVDGSDLGSFIEDIDSALVSMDDLESFANEFGTLSCF